jgi:hypothetical protein
MLLKLVARKAAHIAARAGVRDVVGTPHNVPPQRQHLLPLNELSSPVSPSKEQAVYAPCRRRTFSSPSGLFPRARSRDTGFVLTVA